MNLTTWRIHELRHLLLLLDSDSDTPTHVAHDAQIQWANLSYGRGYQSARLILPCKYTVACLKIESLFCPRS